MTMNYFILGFPKAKPKNRESITTFSVYQDAASACSDCVGIYRETIEVAKDRFMELANNGFLPTNKI